MSKEELKSYLEGLEKEKLIEIILSTFATNNDAKNYLNYMSRPNQSEEYYVVKDIIDEEFSSAEEFPPNGRFTVVVNAINDFKKLDPSKELVAKLMLYLIEQSVLYFDKYGVSGDEEFEWNIINNFDIALEFIKENDLLEKFKDRCKGITHITDFSFIEENLTDAFKEYYYNN